jgi:TonB family protein
MPITSFTRRFRERARRATFAVLLALPSLAPAAPIVDAGLLDTRPKPVSTPDPVYPEGYKESGERGMVVLELLIDPQGRVVDRSVMSSTDPSLAYAALKATESWTCEPGIKDRSPVYTRMRVPFEFGPEDDAARSKGSFTAPVVTYQERPVYPFSLRLSRVRGQVMVGFVVDPQGNVIQPTVIESTHPDFEAPTIEAILNWKFKPGVHNGHPAYTHMEVPVIFQLTYAEGRLGGADAWSVPDKASSKLPEMYRYDEPPKPILIGAPVYPYELLVGNIKGKASVAFAVDPTGRTRSITVSSASRPEFGAAAAAMVAAWRFDPAMQGGKPSWSLLKKDQDFSRNDEDFPMSDSALRLLRELRKSPCPILTSAAALDVPLKGRFQPGPVVPPSVSKADVPATASIVFIVDHAGHAQLPRIASSTSEEFGWAAATAISRWQFNAPTVKGRPVDVFVEIPVAFRPRQADARPADPAPPGAP